MKKSKKSIQNIASSAKLFSDYCNLTKKILRSASREVSQIDFLKVTSKYLLIFSGCDGIELWLQEDEKFIHWRAHLNQDWDIEYELTKGEIKDEEISNKNKFLGFKRIFGDVFTSNVSVSHPFLTENGSFWTGNIEKTFIDEDKTELREILVDKKFQSVAIIPFAIDNSNNGFLQLNSKNEYFFTEKEIILYEGITQTFGVAIANSRAQSALKERIKELTCLYGISQLAHKQDLTLNEILTRVVKLLPPSFKYPNVCSAAITCYGKKYETENFSGSDYKLRSPIKINDKKIGWVEVAYSIGSDEFEEYLFLPEEQNLLDTVSTQLSLIIERKKAEEERELLEEQLRHADRLATIGQLSSGIAHELNEPLGNILGFAQLIKKNDDIPDSIKDDIEKIIKASLHSREVIKKLMLFARQMPTKKDKTDLNKLIQEGLYFIETRCKKEGIKLVKELSPDMPEIIADSSQLYQVLVNLVVNGIQAMENGGTLRIKTVAHRDKNYVSILVSDTGVGIDKNMISKIFMPFFTTKDIGEGTGLGLAVVHGIVSAHNGKIDVSSEPNKGTTFEIKLPINYESEE